MERAVERNVPIRLAALRKNRAIDMYRRLGFQEPSRTDTHVPLEWPPRSVGPSKAGAFPGFRVPCSRVRPESDSACSCRAARDAEHVRVCDDPRGSEVEALDALDLKAGRLDEPSVSRAL